jgi:hypothetical protein
MSALEHHSRYVEPSVRSGDTREGALPRRGRGGEAVCPVGAKWAAKRLELGGSDRLDEGARVREDCGTGSG